MKGQNVLYFIVISFSTTYVAVMFQTLTFTLF